jgi:hypothetical protein
MRNGQPWPRRADAIFAETVESQKKEPDSPTDQDRSACDPYFAAPAQAQDRASQYAFFLSERFTFAVRDDMDVVEFLGTKAGLDVFLDHASG